MKGTPKSQLSVPVEYFSSAGPDHTRATVMAACRRAGELKIREVLVATETGRTALALADRFKGGKVIAVSYHSGTGAPFDDPLPPPARQALAKKGVAILTCGHAFSGAEKAAARIGGGAPLALVAQTLRLFGQGTKVAVEIVLMAADAGLLSGRDVIAIGGTAAGADTALVIAPAHQGDMFSLRVREIICKPRDFGE